MNMKKTEAAFLFLAMIFMNVGTVKSQEVEILSERLPAHAFTSVRESCEVPCKLHLLGAEEVTLFFPGTHESSGNKDIYGERSFFDIAIIHIPPDYDSNTIFLPAFDGYDHFFEFQLSDDSEGLDCHFLGNGREKTCSFRADDFSDDWYTIWNDTDKEHMYNISLSPNRKHYVLGTEKKGFAATQDYLELQHQLYLGNLIPLEGGYDNFEKNRTLFPLAPLQRGVSRGFSADSDWLLVEIRNNTPKESGEIALSYEYKIINMTNIDLQYNVISGDNVSICMWNPTKTLLYCNQNAGIDRVLTIFELDNGQFNSYTYPNTNLPTRAGYGIRWIDGYLYSSIYYSRNLDLYEPKTGELARQLKGEYIFLYSPKEKLLITKEKIDGNHDYSLKTLHFYRDLEYEGSKEYIFNYENKNEIGIKRDTVESLSGLYNFLLNFPSERISTQDLLNYFDICQEENQKYLLYGDWLVVPKHPKLVLENGKFEQFMYIYDLLLSDNTYRNTLHLDLDYKDTYMINAVTDYYFFPKPEVQK